MTNYFLTDGIKTVPFEGGTWDFIDMVASGNMTSNVLYARVAAVFQAVNKTAKATANVPFALVDVASGEDYDISWAWENKVKFMPHPKDLIRRVEQSIIMTNMGYLRMGKNMLRQPKRLHFCIPDSIRINLTAMGDLENLERVVSGQTVQTYAPDDYDLMRFWWLDEKTELVPTNDTEFKAAMNAAEILYYADFFTANFYKRGGIKPTLIAMKGMVSKDKAKDEEEGWSKFLRGLGRKAVTNVARIFNADTMDVKPFGDGLGDLKETPVYKQALENVSMALGMPFSIMISNSSNHATAEVENMQWHEDSIFPRVDFLCDVCNDQLFTPMGLRMEPRPENTDDGADEATRSQAFNGFGDGFAKYPDAETFIGAADMFGFELDDKMQAAVTAHYKAKEKQADEMAEQVDEQPQDAVPGETPTAEQEDEQGDETKGYNPDQPRDESGRFGEGGGGSSAGGHDPKSGAYTVYHSSIGKMDASEKIIGGEHAGKTVGDLQKASETSADTVLGRVEQNASSYAPVAEKDPIAFDVAIATSYEQQMTKNFGKGWSNLDVMSKNAAGQAAIRGITRRDHDDLVKTLQYQAKAILENSKKSLDDFDARAKSWQPTIDELNELRVWRDVALRRFKKGESLDFEYEPHYGGLPEQITMSIKTCLKFNGVTEAGIKDAFDIGYDVPPAASDIKALADAINRLAESRTK